MDILSNFSHYLVYGRTKSYFGLNDSGCSPRCNFKVSDFKEGLELSQVRESKVFKDIYPVWITWSSQLFNVLKKWLKGCFKCCRTGTNNVMSFWNICWTVCYRLYTNKELKRTFHSGSNIHEKREGKGKLYFKCVMLSLNLKT